MGWGSLYGYTDDSEESMRRKRVGHLLDEFSRQFLPRSVWLMETNPTEIESFIGKAEELSSGFSAEMYASGAAWRSA